jgi:Na+-transporting methylmalonyl-CoA/oxaloacetate decarboxylase gamma subunit
MYYHNELLYKVNDMDTNKAGESQAQTAAPVVAPQTIEVTHSIYDVSDDTKVVAAITAAIMHHTQG